MIPREPVPRVHAARELAAVFAGGFAGAVARLGLIEAFPYEVGEWPWPTFLANVIGAFALGWLAASFWEESSRSSHRRPLLGIGFCGALTTFSTMQLELVLMLEAGDLGLFAGYMAASVISGLGAVTIGLGLGRDLRPKSSAP